MIIMPASRQESALRARAREFMREGKLPSVKASQVWGGIGSGMSCSLCGEPIRPDEPEFELEFREAPSQGCVLHADCHAAWELECAAANR